MGKSKDVYWKTADWTKRDSELARDYGVTRQAAFQARRKYAPETRHRPHWQTQRKAQALARLATLDTSNMTIGEVGDWLGVCGETARVYLLELGRTVSNGGVLSGQVRLRGVRPDNWQFDWGSLTDEDWATKSNTQIARELGCSVPTVLTNRRRWNKPKGVDGRVVANRERLSRPKESRKDAILRMARAKYRSWSDIRQEILDEIA